MIKKDLDPKKRVVVTGLGVVSSLGIGWEEFWKNLLAGKSGISKITTFDTSHYERHYAGEVKNFDATKFISKKRFAQIGRASQMAIAASKLALEDAGLKISAIRGKKIPVLLGLTMAEMGILEGHNDEQFDVVRELAEKKDFVAFPANSLSANVAQEFKLTGHHLSFSTACASGNYAIGNAFDLIRAGECDYAFAGGADRFSRVVFTGFGRLFAIAPEKCQPFDRNRKGMIPAEAAGILLLENLESARHREARIYAEILDYGLSCDAKHMTDPSPEGIQKAIQKSLLNSKVNIESVDYVSAHGTGTVENDKAECLALKRIFGERLRNVPVSSIKSMLGHTMGAASALEAIACCLSVKFNEIPPTINYETPDPECEIDCVPSKGRKHEVRVALNNSSAFGGNNACVVLGKVKRQ